MISFFCFVQVEAHLSADTAELYGSIGRKLAQIKKEFPDAASKIGSVLDDVDRMKQAVDSVARQDRAAMKELETRTLEISVFEKELLLAKQENEVLKQSVTDLKLQVVALEKKVVEGRAQIALLKEQNEQSLKQKRDTPSDLISAKVVSEIDKQLAVGGDKAASPVTKKPAEAIDPSSERIKTLDAVESAANVTKKIAVSSSIARRS